MSVSDRPHGDDPSEETPSPDVVVAEPPLGETPHSNAWWQSDIGLTRRLTSDDIRQAIERAHGPEAMAAWRRERTERADRYVAFVRSVPKHLENHPLVAMGAASIMEGWPLAPGTYDRLRRLLGEA